MSGTLTTLMPLRAVLRAHQAPADEQPGVVADHAQRAEAHAELAMVDHRARLDLELLAGPGHGGADLERRVLARGVEHAAERHRVAVELGGVGLEAHPRVLSGVEERRRAEVLVAPPVAGVEALGL